LCRPPNTNPNPNPNPTSPQHSLTHSLTHTQIGYLQTWLLYHNALSAGVAIEDVLKYARSSKEKSRSDTDVINELRSQVQEQDRLLKALAAGGAVGLGASAAGGERSGLLSGASARGTTSGYGALQAQLDGHFNQAQGQGQGQGMIELSSDIGRRGVPAAAFADGGKKVCFPLFLSLPCLCLPLSLSLFLPLCVFSSSPVLTPFSLFSPFSLSDARFLAPLQHPRQPQGAGLHANQRPQPRARLCVCTRVCARVRTRPAAAALPLVKKPSLRHHAAAAAVGRVWA